MSRSLFCSVAVSFNNAYFLAHCSLPGAVPDQLLYYSRYTALILTANWAWNTSHELYLCTTQSQRDKIFYFSKLAFLLPIVSQLSNLEKKKKGVGTHLLPFFRPPSTWGSNYIGLCNCLFPKCKAAIQGICYQCTMLCFSSVIPLADSVHTGWTKVRRKASSSFHHTREKRYWSYTLQSEINNFPFPTTVLASSFLDFALYIFHLENTSSFGCLF